MRNLNYELTITRGESVDLDFEIVNGDGSPYILYKRLTNPHVVITIVSTYNSVTPYYCNYWLDLKSYPKFDHTEPLPVRDFASYPPYKPDGEQYDFDDENLVGDVAVFVFTNDKGVKEYKYWRDGEYVDYSLRLVKNFSVKDTSELVSQNYMYNIHLLAGDLNKELNGPALKNIYEDIVLLPDTVLTVRRNVNGGIYAR